MVNPQSNAHFESNARFEIVLWRRSALLEGNRRSQMPLGATPWSVWGWLAPLLFLIVGGIAFFWAVEHIERTVESSAAQVLVDAGIDPAGLAFTANYRDLQISGDLPDTVSPQMVEQALESEKSSAFDVRDAVFVADEPIVGVPEFARIEVSAVSDGSMITLVGVVPLREHEDSILSAVNSTGLLVVNNLTVSGLAPDAEEPEEQIAAFGDALATLTPDSFSSARLSIANTGPVTGEISATNQDAASVFSEIDGDDVSVSAPPLLGALSISATYDGERIVLDGTVLSASQQNRLLTSAAGVVGFRNVVNNLNISRLDEVVEGAEQRIDVLAAVFRTFDGLISGDAFLNDTDVTVNGVAVDENRRGSSLDALNAGEDVGLRPGGVITLSESLPIAQQIDLLQVELDSLAEEVRETVRFEFGSVTLTPDAEATLDSVAAALQQYPQPVVEIGGHTDSSGSAAFNVALSQQRADAVAAYLGEQIDPGRLAAIGFGESQPIADNATVEGQEANRRVEFIAQESF